MRLTQYDLAQNKAAFMAAQRRKRGNSFTKLVPDDEMLDDLRDLSIRAVCEKYGIARNTVQKLLNEHGIVKDKEKTGAGKIEPSPEMLADIKTLSYKQVKAKYNIGYSTITRIRTDYGLLSPNVVWTADKVASMFEMQASGLTIAQIAEKIGVHETTAGRVMIKAKREGMSAFNND